MAFLVTVEIEMPDGWEDFRLPKRLHRRLQDLLDRQEREEAQGLVDMAEWILLLRLQARLLSGDAAQK